MTISALQLFTIGIGPSSSHTVGPMRAGGMFVSALAKRGVLTRTARLRKLFFSMLYISSFTFGGGFVIATFIKKRFVDELHWINDQEIMDMIALAQSSPGAIAVNVAILVGWRVAGFAGMCMSVLGTIQSI